MGVWVAVARLQAVIPVNAARARKRSKYILVGFINNMMPLPDLFVKIKSRCADNRTDKHKTPHPCPSPVGRMVRSDAFTPFPIGRGVAAYRRKYCVYTAGVRGFCIDTQTIIRRPVFTS
jgi:hypothetical protein